MQSSFKIDGHGVPKWHPPTNAGAPKFYEGSSKDNIWNKCLMTKAMNAAESDYLTKIATGVHDSQKILQDRDKVCILMILAA